MRRSGSAAGGCANLNPLVAKGAAFSGEGEARHPSLHEWRAVARRHVRSEAGARRNITARNLPIDLDTERKTGAALRVAVQVPEVRPERDRGQRAFREDRGVDRRHLRHPLDARGRAESRAVAAADELRRGAADPAEHGLVGHLRPRHARIRTCPASSPCARAAIRSRNRRTGRAGFCPASSRARTSTRSTPTIEKLIENIQNNYASHAGAARAARSAAAAQRTSIAKRGRTTRSSKRASNRSNWPIACRWTRPTRSTSSREPEHIREMYGDGDAGAADADRAAAGRARRALRAGLARRGPAVGQPRRHRDEPPQARRANATRRSARC